MLRLKLVLSAAVLAAVAGALIFWTYGRGDGGAEAGAQRVRWFDVSVVIPEGSGLFSAQRYWQDDRPVLIVGPAHDISLGLVIDATTGEVMSDDTLPEFRTAGNQVLQSPTVSALDHSTAPWPYNGQSPSEIPQVWGMTTWGKVTFIPPDPASGIRVVLQEGDGTDGASKAVGFTNGRSTLAINAGTGAVEPGTTTSLAEDQEAFDRLLSTVRLVDQ